MAKLMRLAALFARVKAGYKSRGFDYLLEAGLNLLPHNLLFFERNLLMVADTCNIPVRDHSGYEIRLVTPEDLPKITAFSFSIERLQRELREGSVGIMILKEGKIVAWRWAAIGALYVEYCNTVIDMGDNGYYTSRLETVPEERGKGHANTCFRTMHEYFGNLNRRLNYTLVASRDTRSRTIHERYGFRTIGDIFMLNIFWLHFCFYRKWPFHNKRVALYVRIPPAGTRIV
jgi:RimJ/RimL family protein N-acetyltransferase